MTAKTRNPLASGLLEVAEHLAQICGRRIVEQSAFRRAISSAYYAIFYTLCQICVGGLGPWTSAPDELEPIYRNLKHAKAREVLSSAKAKRCMRTSSGSAAFSSSFADYEKTPTTASLAVSEQTKGCLRAAKREH